MASSGGASLTTGGPVMTAGVPKPPAPKVNNKPSKPAKPSKPIQVKAHNRAAPTTRPSKPQAAQTTTNPLLDPNQSLSGQNLLDAARQLANTQTQGPLAELQRQIAANNNQTQGTVNAVGGFYNQLEPFVQQGVTNSGNIASGLNSQLAGIGSDTQNQLGALGQSTLANIQKYAPPGDGSTDNAAVSDLASQIARQQGLAAQNAGTYRSFGAVQGAGLQGAANANLGAYGMQGQEALRGIAQSGTVKNEPLVQKIADLQASQGALTATDLGKLRQQEVSNQIARVGLNIKGQSAATTAQNDAANQALKAAGIKVTAQNDAATQALRRAGISVQQQNNLANQALHAAQLNEKTGNDAANQALKQAAMNLKTGKGSAKPLVQSQQNTIYRNLGEMVQLIGVAQKQGESEAKIRQALQLGQVQKGFPAQSQVLVQAAYELKGWGHITPQTANAMRVMGLRAGTYNGQAIKVAPPPSGVAKTVGQTGSTGALGSL